MIRHARLSPEIPVILRFLAKMRSFLLTDFDRVVLSRQKELRGDFFVVSRLVLIRSFPGSFVILVGLDWD